MANTRRIIKVFLASPGDLKDERRAAKSVVDEFNSNWADHLTYQVELVGWEDTVSVYGRPQAIINRDLEPCEYFIGLMWKKWGTPPDNSRKFTSGFEEEYQISVTNREKKGQPEISMLFKEIEPDLLDDPGDDLKKVIAFKKRLISEKKILFEVFHDLPSFKQIFGRCITRFVQEIRSREVQESIGARKARSPAESLTSNTAEAPSNPESPFPPEAIEFLRNFIFKRESADDEQEIAAAEVARFRLLAGVTKKHGNDDQFLGGHDANILFVHRDQLTLSRRELAGLISCGLAHFSSETIPLWCWLTKIDAFNRNWLQLYTLIQTTEVQIGALSAMRLVAEPLTSERPWSRDKCIENWFADGASLQLKTAALQYLADCGTVDDLPAIRKELEERHYQTSSSAIDAILRISLRESRELAIHELFKNQPESVEPLLLAALFDRSASIETELLLQGIDIPNSDVRLVIVKLLKQRECLEADIADRLTADSDARIRFEALKALANSGRKITDEEARRILVRPEATQNALLGAFGSPTDNRGEECWQLYRKERIQEMNIQVLELTAAENLDLDRFAQFALDFRQFSSRGDRLRAAIDDQYKSVFADLIESLQRAFGEESQLIEHTKALEKHLRKQYMSNGLDIICKKGGPQDLNRVRQALKSEYAVYSISHVEYLRKYGEWTDISLIVSMHDRPRFGQGSTLLSSFEKDRVKTIAHLVYKIGRSRFRELISLDFPVRLLAFVVAMSSEKVFRTLNNDSINQLLLSAHDDVRKAAALKCVQTFPKHRLKELLNDYLSNEENYYYNVIHWLDFGLSLPSDRARPAAKKAIAGQWQI